MIKKRITVVKHTISMRTIVTHKWKESAERELSDALSIINEEIANLEYEAHDIISEIYSQAVAIVPPEILKIQIDMIQEQVSIKKMELEDEQYSILEEQDLLRSIQVEDIVEQGSLEGFCELKVGDNLIEKLGGSILLRDGIIESIENL